MQRGGGPYAGRVGTIPGGAAIVAAHCRRWSAQTPLPQRTSSDRPSCGRTGAVVSRCSWPSRLRRTAPWLWRRCTGGTWRPRAGSGSCFGRARCRGRGNTTRSGASSYATSPSRSSAATASVAASAVCTQRSRLTVIALRKLRPCISSSLLHRSASNTEALFTAAKGSSAGRWSNHALWHWVAP